MRVGVGDVRSPLSQQQTIESDGTSVDWTDGIAIAASCIVAAWQHDRGVGSAFVGRAWQQGCVPKSMRQHQCPGTMSVPTTSIDDISRKPNMRPTTPEVPNSFS